MSDNPNLNEQAPITGTEPGQQAGDTKTERTFTQADLDRMIKERLDKQERSLLQKLGVTSLDEAKAAAQRVKEIDEASKTEVQKLSEKLTALELSARQAQAQRDAALIQSAVVAEAGTQGIAPDRFKAVVKLLDTSKLQVHEDGTVEGMADAFKAMLDENPFLKADASKPNKPSVSATNPAGMGNTGPDVEWLKAYRTGNGGKTFGDGGLRYPGDKK